VQERPTLKSKAKKADPDEKPRKRPRDDDDDEDEGPPKKRSRAADDDDDEEDEDDDRPAKKKKTKGGSMMMVILFLVLGGGFLLSLGLVGIGLFVWPGWLVSKSEPNQIAKDGPAKDAPARNDDMPNPGGNNNPPPIGNPGNDLTRYVFPDAAILFGANIKGVREKNQLDGLLAELDKIPGAGGKSPQEFINLFKNADNLLVCMAMPDQPKPKLMIMIQASNADAITKFRGSPKMGQEEKLGGKYTAYRPIRVDPT
jgi:hypothetical protein